MFVSVYPQGIEYEGVDGSRNSWGVSKASQSEDTGRILHGSDEV